jgi:spore coat polysaccharide biosynthesis protein SpsF
MKIVGIIQARMSSTRLPGKVMLPILGKAMLSHHVERLLRSRRLHELVVATTDSDKEIPIVDLCHQLAVPIFRGAEQNVLERYFQAASQVKADVVVRICSDSPLTDPVLLDELIDYFVSHQGQYDHVYNGKSLPLGMGSEIFTMQALTKAYEEAHLPEEQEHVTPYISRHPERFKLGTLFYPDNSSHYRLTVDTPEDFQLIQAIFKQLYPVNPAFGYPEIIRLLESRPELSQINAHVKQKQVGQ